MALAAEFGFQNFRTISISRLLGEPISANISISVNITDFRGVYAIPYTEGPESQKLGFKVKGAIKYSENYPTINAGLEIGDGRGYLGDSVITH